jgi:hypothetical protein
LIFPNSLNLIHSKTSLWVLWKKLSCKRVTFSETLKISFSEGDIDFEMMDDGMSTHSACSNNEERNDDTISDYEDRSFR